MFGLNVLRLDTLCIALQLQMNAGVMVRRVGTVPGPFRAADRALAEAQGYQGKMQENGALQSDRVSRFSQRLTTRRAFSIRFLVESSGGPWHVCWQGSCRGLLPTTAV